MPIVLVQVHVKPGAVTEFGQATLENTRSNCSGAWEWRPGYSMRTLNSPSVAL